MLRKQITEYKPKHLMLHNILDQLGISSSGGALRKRILWTKETRCVKDFGPSPLEKILPAFWLMKQIAMWHERYHKQHMAEILKRRDA